MHVPRPALFTAYRLPFRKYRECSGFADCYCVQVTRHVTQAKFIQAFYTLRLFKLERTLLQLLASKPATDADAKRLARCQASTFSAWKVESQTASELLLADFTGRTRSWLMTEQIEPASGSARLYFGSVVLAHAGYGTQKPSMGWFFHALLGFHRIYSKLLLRAASGKVMVR